MELVNRNVASRTRPEGIQNAIQAAELAGWREYSQA